MCTRTLFSWLPHRVAIAPEQLQQTQLMLRTALRDANLDDFTIIYGYVVKRGLVAVRILSYAIAFSESDGILVLIRISPDTLTEAGPILLDRSTLISVSDTVILDEKLFVSPLLKKDLRIVIPAHSCGHTYGNGCGILPVAQSKEVMSFERMLKNHHRYVPKRCVFLHYWL